MIHACAADVAADWDASPEPLLFRLPLLQRADQCQIVTVYGDVPEVPPPAGQFAVTHACPADAAADCEVNPEPLLLPPPLRQRADQL